MSTRTAPGPAFPEYDGGARCPCLSGEVFRDCCGRIHADRTAGGTGAVTAEAHMRSRYSAFAVGDTAYLLESWHPSTRPSTLELDPDMAWRRLDIVDTVAGGPFDDTGIVEFAAHYRGGGERGVQRERSRFVREDGRWYYVDAL
ncbi:MAG TPA: YchJ family metal-binding protein [Arthrobacter sp.]|nr:YchJ family metal-binding protein [Arthrobacter sp.]